MWVVFDMKSTIELMKQYQAWRRGADIPQPSPAAIGAGLDQLILAAERYEKVRRLTPHQFKGLWKRNMAGEWFDDLVDAL